MTKMIAIVARAATTALLATCLCAIPARAQQQPDPTKRTSADLFMVGADLSFVKQQEDKGVKFKDNGVVKPVLDIFKDHGYEWIRLRVFHRPTDLPNSLDYTIALAKEAKARGYKFLLDYHYSDTWADPQHQVTPAGWDTVNVRVLADTVRNYTRDVFKAFMNAGVTPDMVQIGNEVRVGFMWPLGKLPAHWDNFATLYQAALAGIDEARGRAPRPILLLHYDNGGDAINARKFFDTANQHKLPYDIIGYSYYPWWHGNLIMLRDNLLSTLEHFPDKDVMLVEVGYRPGTYQYEKRTPPYPDDAPGGPRKAFLEAVTQTLLSIDSRRVKGIFWWEPAWGCNSDFFDEQCNARPVITVFDHYVRR